MPSSEELKPCPFCDGKADSGEYERVWSIGCNNDDCLGPAVTAPTEADAIAIWNRRAPTAADTPKPHAWAQWARVTERHGGVQRRELLTASLPFGPENGDDGCKYEYLGEPQPLYLHPVPAAADTGGLVERLIEGARDIDNDGTASQVGPTADECRAAAAALSRLQAELDTAQDEVLRHNEGAVLRAFRKQLAAAREQIAELERERNEWRRKYNRLTDLRADAGGHYVMECEWEQRGIDLAAAHETIRAMQEALEPFANDAERLRNYPDDYPYGFPITPITVGDFRRARAARTPLPEGGQ